MDAITRIVFYRNINKNCVGQQKVTLSDYKPSSELLVFNSFLGNSLSISITNFMSFLKKILDSPIEQVFLPSRPLHVTVGHFLDPWDMQFCNSELGSSLLFLSDLDKGKIGLFFVS